MRSVLVLTGLLCACGDNIAEPPVSPGVPPPAPTDVLASDGTSADVVEVRWTAVDGATGYRVWRDGAVIAAVTEPAFDDETATAGTGSAPVLTASAGTNVSGVELSWTAFASSPGPMYTYSVTSTRASDESLPSQPDNGYRGGYELAGYEVSTDGGQTYPIMLPATTLAYTDANAPLRTIEGVVAASDGTFTTHVAASISATTVSPAAATYVVRAATNGGVFFPSNAADGYRNVGSLTYQWYRYTFGDIGPGPRTIMAGEVGDTLVDATAEAGRGYAYDCDITALGATPTTTKPDMGWRAFSPAEIPRKDTWVTDRFNGAVTAVAAASDAIYIGGTFTYVGPPTGSLAALDATTGELALSLAAVHSQRLLSPGVQAAVQDGSGGWYIAGDFTSVDGVPQARLAHLAASGALDRAFAPVIYSGLVTSLERVGTELYVGGEFTTADWQPRQNVAVFDTTTGALEPFALALGDPTSNGDTYVSNLFVRSGRLYLSGNFTSVNGVARRGVAAIDLATQSVAAWDPQANTDVVRIGAFVGSTLFVYGAFTQIGGLARNGLAAVDATTGQATAFDPGAHAGGRIVSLATDGTTVYIGGDFTQVAGQSRNGLAALDASTGTLLAFATAAPDPSYPPLFAALALRGTTLYVAGHFIIPGSNAREGLSAFDATTGALLSWAPTPEHFTAPSSLTLVNNTILVGGSFESVGGKLQSTLAALDPSTGALLDWNPSVEGSVTAMAVSGNSLFVTGSLSFDGGQTIEHFVRLDRTTGARIPWTDLGTFTDLLVDGNVLYVAGAAYLRAIDLTTGALTAWDPAPDGAVSRIAVSGSTLYAAGSFMSIGGQSRSYLAGIDTTSAQATSWTPTPSSAVVDLATDSGRLYAGGSFTIASPSRSNLASFDLGTGGLTSWAPASPRVSTLAVVGNEVFVAGPDGSRAFDATTASALAWNPWQAGSVARLVSGAASLIAVGSFREVAGRSRSGIAIFDP